MPKALVYRKSLIDSEGKPLVLPVLEVGNANEMHRCEDFAKLWGMVRPNGTIDLAAAIRYLSAIGVPVVCMPDRRVYFNVAAFEKALYFVSRFGGPGFAPAGSAIKVLRARKSPKNGKPVAYANSNPPDKVTPEVVKKFSPKDLDKEMALAAETRKASTRRSLYDMSRRYGKVVERNAIAATRAYEEAIAGVNPDPDGGPQE